MKPRWTGDAVKKMHINDITQKDLAEEMGVTQAMVSMILSGYRDTPQMKEKFLTALDRIIAKRTS